MRKETFAMSSELQTYFQYFKEFDYPLGISISPEIFDSESFNTLKLLGFSEIAKDEWDAKKKTFRKVQVLSPTPVMQHYLDKNSLLGFQGKESLSLKTKNRIYKFQNRGILEFSERHLPWTLHLVESDDATSLFKAEFMHILNRIISWALIDYNCIGFWGVPVEEGLISMKATESKSEAFFIDLTNQRILTLDGAFTISSKLQILRLDSTLQPSSSRGMRPEELYSFLLHRSALFHPAGTHKQVKLAVSYLASHAKGLIWPRGSFTPRTDLDVVNALAKQV